MAKPKLISIPEEAGIDESQAKGVSYAKLMVMNF